LRASATCTGATRLCCHGVPSSPRLRSRGTIYDRTACEQGLYIDFDLSALTYYNKRARYNSYACGVRRRLSHPNEARADRKKKGLPKREKLLQPSNLAAAASQSTGKANGAGRPETDTADAVSPDDVYSCAH
jgi:hypothetical protein